MGRRHALTTWSLALGLLVVLVSPGLAASASPSPIYLSLGTSLSVGVQPDEDGKNQLTDEGYADQLHQLLRLRSPRLQLVKLGCPGETSTSMISGEGSLCTYPKGSQLAQALVFLRANRGAVSLVTIDMGANDLLICTAGGVIDEDCLPQAFATVQANLSTIVAALRAAAPRVPIVAMNYYNPLVAFWLQGDAGQVLAQQSAFLAAQFNDLLEAVYRFFHVPVADVARAFHADDFRLVPGIGLPVNVVLICQWTWMCAPPPQGPNIHANQTGYLVIALTLAAAIH